MQCKQCNHRLDARYVRYKTQQGEPLCQMCYIALGGVV